MCAHDSVGCVKAECVEDLGAAKDLCFLFAACLVLRFALLFFLALAAFSFVSSERIMFVSVPSVSSGTASISNAFLKRLLALAVLVRM